MHLSAIGVSRPVILRVAGYKFLLDPLKIAREGRFRKNELRDIERIIENSL
jgi:hypothetical protein